MSKLNQAMSDLLRYNAAMLPRKRSSFDKSHSHTTTLDSSFLVPVMWDRVLPGDEKKIRYSGLARMTTPIHPVMDQANLDVWCFFVPDRLTWEHAKQFYGENLDASFNPDGRYQMPSMGYSDYVIWNQTGGSYAPDSPNGLNTVGGLCDYFGMPTYDITDSSLRTRLNGDGTRINGLLFRGYQLIWNEWFRNSSIQPALQLNTGDTINALEASLIKTIRRVNKNPDYFTTLLREPQAGADVTLPLGDWAPVVTRPDAAYDNGNGITPLQMYVVGGTAGAGLLGYNANGTVQTNTASIGTYKGDVSPSNLWTDLTNATSATINNIRAAVTVQHLLEVDAIAGKRYQQIIQAHFGVFTPDATLQRPELLGASRTPIGMRQVLQTYANEASNGTITGSPVGNTGAFSLTNVTNEWICNKSFTEPGFIYVLAAVRPTHAYSQGIDRLLTKLDRYDHYWPVFDNLGNQPVYKKEIFACGVKDDTYSYDNAMSVFGYQEAWTEYKIKNNRVSGLFRPNVKGSLSSWVYADNFTSANIVLDSDFVSENENLIKNTVANQTEPQFLLDNYFDYIDIKNMSVHSVPGVTKL